MDALDVFIDILVYELIMLETKEGVGFFTFVVLLIFLTVTTCESNN